MKSTPTVSEGAFRSYLKVQKGGKTNMFDVRAVIKLSGYKIIAEEVALVMDNYEELEKQYPEVVKEIFGA